jgi:lambda family phage tail tape measure protein
VAISAQELNIILTAKDKQFAKAMADNQKRVERFAAKSQRDLSKTGKSFSALGTAAKRLAPLLAAAFGARAISNMINAAAEIGNLASVAGLSVERFQEVAFAAQQFGVSAEKMADILKDVNDKFGDFVQTGAGPLADFFENIAPAVGLTADAFAKLSSEQKLGKYIQALEKANLSQDDMTFYMEAIASDSTLLQGAFANNGAELDRLSTKIRDAGGVMDKEMIDKAKEAKEEFALTSQIISNQFAIAIKDLTPLLRDSATAIGNIAAGIGTMYTEAKRVLGLQEESPQLQAFNKDLEAEMLDIKARNKRRELDSVTHISKSRREMEERIAAQYEAQAKALRAEANALRDGGAAPASPAGIAVLPKLTITGKPPPTAPEREAEEKRLKMLGKAYADAAAEFEDAVAQMEADQVDRLRDVQAAYDSVRGSIDPLYAAYQQTAQAIGAVNDALAEGIITEQQASADREQLIEHLKQTQDELSGMKDLMNSLEQSVSTAFGEFITGSASAEDAFKRLASTIIQELIRIEIQNARLGKASLVGSLFDFLGGLFGGGGHGGATALASGVPAAQSLGVLGFAKGGVFSGGNIMPFARGGVINRPTLFPMAKGAGLMGEAGPEAIMPLKRGPDGKLGVAGGGASVNVNIINQAGAEVDTRQNGPDIDVIIRKAVASDIAGGGQIYRAIGQRFEASTRLNRR